MAKSRIDQNELDQLFHLDPRPDDRIQIALMSIARIAAAGARCPRSDREDVASELFLFMTTAILPKYQPKPGAFSYFFTVATRQSWRIVARSGRDRRNMVALPNDLSVQALRRPMPAAISPRWRCTDPIARIDRVLMKLGRVARNGESARAIEAATVAAEYIQELRFDLVGKYRNLKLPGIIYAHNARN